MAKIFPTNLVILTKQVAPLFKSTLSGGIGNILAAFLAYLLLKDTQLQTSALQIFVMLSTVSVIRIIVSSIYLETRSNIHIYLHTHVILTLIIGMLWGYLAYNLLGSTDESLRNLIFLIMFGLIAASIATLSSWLLSYLVYVVPQSIVILYVFSEIDSEYNYYMVLAYLIFIVSMILTSVRFNRNHQKQIDLIFNNKQLIEDLNSEIRIRENFQLELEIKKTDLERNKAELEDKVTARTQELSNINTDLEKVIVEKEQAEKNLQYLAYHDELTGLPNKNLLVDRINQSIKISSRDNQQMAILFLDLDRFKNINDSLGHIVGDKLIQEVASRMHKTLRSHDTVSRNGGDEFVIVLERLKNHNEAIYVANKVIHCLTDTFDILSHKIHIGASIGISVFPSDGDTPLVLLRNADTAMYRAKQAGGNQLQFYDPSMSNQLRDRIELENELHSALVNNEFYLVYQPQVNSETGETIGLEALIRWENPKHGFIPPDRFVPLLEETGLIYSVGEWVVTEVLKFIKVLKHDEITFSINLSPLQCTNLRFTNYFKRQVDISGVNPGQIEFEITESLLINDFEKTKTCLDELHSFGCTIALDDFGTGYTSMTYLARLPIDVIKIDRSLIQNINENKSLQSIVKAIVTMSHSLGKKNIFEGIENISELNEIIKMDGKIIQGYLFSKPLKAPEVEEWLHRERPHHSEKSA